MLVIKPRVEMISNNNYEEMLKKIERIGRVCYKSEQNVKEGSDITFIQNILDRGHESVIEHESISVKVICDRGVSHEIVRHRVASYSQESTRYCNYGKEKFQGQITCIDIASGFAYDLSDETDQKKYNVWMELMERSENAYQQLLELGATAQEARSVLPNSLKTELVITMNLREWRHFFRLRLSNRAHPQMREVAQLIFHIFEERFPLFFKNIKQEIDK